MIVTFWLFLRKSSKANIDDLPVKNTLDVTWNVFEFKVVNQNKPNAKPRIFSTVSSLFDPLGFIWFICPVVSEAKNLTVVKAKTELG